jgi:hypothetical protein
MYVPKPFREDDPETLHAAMKDIGVAAIVGQGRDGLIATHAPIELDPDPAPLGRIRLHMARANPHADMMVDGEELESPYGSGEYMHALEARFGDIHDKLVLSEIENKDTIFDSIRRFLGKGK